MYVRAGGKAVGEIAKACALCSRAAMRSLGGFSLAAKDEARLLHLVQVMNIGVNIPVCFRLLCSLGSGRACEVVLSLPRWAAVAKLTAEHYWCSGGGSSLAESGPEETLRIYEPG